MDLSLYHDKKHAQYTKHKSSASFYRSPFLRFYIFTERKPNETPKPPLRTAL